MTDNFTSLEIQLVRARLATDTDEQIAELLERPAKEVRELINVITEGKAIERDSTVEQLQRESKERHAHKKKQKKEKKKEAPKRETSFEDDGRIRRDRVSREVANKNEKFRVASQKKQAAQVLKTRVIDYSQMVLVNINRSTQIYLPKAMKHREREKFILQYKLREQERLSVYKKSE